MGKSHNILMTVYCLVFVTIFVGYITFIIALATMTLGDYLEKLSSDALLIECPADAFEVQPREDSQTYSARITKQFLDNLNRRE